MRVPRLRRLIGRLPARFSAGFFALSIAALLLASCSFFADLASPSFSFMVTADMRDFTAGSQYFAGACDAIVLAGKGHFMISPGDIDPPDAVLATIRERIPGDYPWYPVVGNHEAETASDMAWLRSYNAGGNALPMVVNVGPPNAVETNYSFDFQNAHFVVINEYYDGITDDAPGGDISQALLAWLESDLAANTRPIVFVFGHEPAFPQPDAETGRVRHLGDSLDAYPVNRDAFWAALKEYGVVAYICGHTHNYSAVKIDGVWQIDAGHSRGIGDTGARSTFIKMTVRQTGTVAYTTWRQDLTANTYVPASSGRL